MTKNELERRISEIEAKGGPDAEPRIQVLRGHFERQQARQEAFAAAEQQRAEAEMRADLKRAYMMNPAATEESFERDYEELRRQKLVGETLRTEAAASRQQREQMRVAF